MANTLIPNVTEFTFSSDGTLLETEGNSNFYPLNNYANLILVNIEDGATQNSLSKINFKIENERKSYTSHWFYMSYQQIVEKEINGTVRFFSQYAIRVPNIVLANNSRTQVKQSEVTIVQRYGSEFLGVYSTLSELTNAYNLTSVGTEIEEDTCSCSISGYFTEYACEQNEGAWSCSNYATLGEQFDLEMSVAYVIATESFYQVDYNSTSEAYEWVEVDNIAQYLQEKQYTIGTINIQKGNTSDFSSETITETTSAYVMQIVQALQQANAELGENLNTLDQLVVNIISGTQPLDKILLSSGNTIEPERTSPQLNDILLRNADGNFVNSQKMVEDKIELDLEISNIEDGTTIVGKATGDKNGNDIVDTYETKVDATTHKARTTALETFRDVTVPLTYETIENVATKVQSAKDYADNGLSLKENLSNKAINLTDVNDTKYPTTQAVKTEIDKKVNKTQTIIGIDLQDNILIGEFKTALGNATSVTSGLMTSQDKTHLDNLVSLLDADDMNTVVDTIGEILHIFENYPEGVNILETLNNKVDKIDGKSLSENDYTDIDKNKVNLAHQHSEIVDGSNPHNTTFVNIVNKPTTRDGYGIADVYTKPETYTQQEINNLLDDLGSVKGLKSTLLTPTEMVNGSTINTTTLSEDGSYIIFTATDTSTGEIDSDTVPISTITTGKKFVFFDNQDIVFTIGETTSIFETNQGTTLKINLLYLDDENVQAIGVDFDGSLTNYLLSQVNVQDAINKLDEEIKTTNDTANNHISNISNPHQVTKEQLNLGNVDNTSDIDKPISTLTQNALGNKSNIGHTHVKADITDFSHTHLIEDITDLIEATQSISGLMSATDKARLDALYELLEEDTANSVVDSINEILAIFNNYPEGADLVSALANKVDKVEGKELSTNDLTNILKSNYDTAYSWGDHAVEGYLKAITKTMVEGVLTGAITSHNHNGTYEPANLNIQTHIVDGSLHFTQNQISITESQISDLGTYEPANANIQTHISAITNPHLVTKTQVGLGNVVNYPIALQAQAEEGLLNDKYMTPLRTAQAIAELSPEPNLTPYDNHIADGSLHFTQNQISVTESQISDLGTYEPANANIQTHINSTSNPHSITTTQIGAEPVFTKNTAFNKDFGTTVGTVTQGNDSRLSDARVPLSHAHGNITNDGKVGTTSGVVLTTTTGGVITTSSRSGIDSRTTFPPTVHTHDDRYYTESETNSLLNAKLNTSLKGAINGLAELGADGKVPSGQLPSYVDDVLEYTSLASFPTTGEAGKIYIAQDNNKTYRWSGSAYAEISASLALGETSSTAYRGDRGKIAFEHTSLTNNPHGTTKTHVGLSNVDNTSDASKPVSTAQQTALNLKENSFSKNTAFNKNFGTALNTVAQGNHLHTGVYEPANPNIQSHISSSSNPHSVTASQVGAEPAFSKNSAFNKNFGTTVGTVTQGNDGRLSDARTPLSHAHGDITNEGAINSTVTIASGDHLVIADNSQSNRLETSTVTFGTGTTTYLRNDGTWGTPPDTNTIYTHPTYTGDDFSIDTGALSGATVISDIDINVTTDTLGHVTDANATVATRNLTLANLGYTGATNANYYTHPSYAGDDINVDTGVLSGSQVISDLDFNITTDTLGHVTDANGVETVRNLDAVRGQQGTDIKFWTGTQASYDAIGTKDANTLYFIT